MKGNPFMPWNDPVRKDDPSEPWNDPCHGSDPTAPWNQPYADERDLEEYYKKRGV